jgi:secondary thiamine-phosphate synthase enzyme
MPHFAKTISVLTKGQGLYTVTREIAAWAANQGIKIGLLTVFIQHTSASLTIQENADPDVLRDVNEFFTRLVPEKESWYRHTSEGPDDMPSHIRAVLTQTSLSIPFIDGRLALGTWQGIYVFEHRARPHHRSLVLHLAGE